MGPEALLARAGLEGPPPTPLSGGDIAQVWRSGDHVLKTHPAPPLGFFPAEAAGLRALARAGVRVPEVRWVGEEGLVLGWLAPGPPDWEGLAEMLVRLHGARVDRYGWEQEGFLATFPLPAGTGTAWTAQWVERRVGPLLAATRGRLGALAGRVERLLATYAPPAEGPVLIHGDLWRGNLHMSADGAALIDPSTWWGERGVDLAMMRLFGGFPPEFWAAYEARLPVPAAVAEAIPYHQLYFLLVHVHLFGKGYLSGVEGVLRRYDA